MLLNPKRPCPKCGTIVPNRHGIGKPYECARCGTKLQLNHIQSNIIFWLGIGVAALISRLLGFRNWGFVGVTIALVVPVGVLAAPIFERVWPSRLELWDGRRVV